MRFKIGPIDFTQPSTWRGAAGIAALCGISLSPELTEQIAIGLGAFLSALEIFRNEHAARQAALPENQAPLPTAKRSLAAAGSAHRLRQPVPTEPETTRSPESPGFGDR